MNTLRIGIAGWAYKDWEGIVYPPQLKRKQHPVEYLAQFLDLIEINTSFYGHIKPESGKLWCRKAAAMNAHFVFTAKLNKCFTHSPLAVLEPTSARTIKPNTEDEKLAKAGLDAVAGEGRLGALLMQFPVSFKNTEENRNYLDSLLLRFREYPRVVEIRHASWNEQAALQHLGELGVGFCNLDQPLIGRSLGRTSHATAAIGYIRLHGRNYEQWFTAERVHDRYDYLYNEEELTRWKPRIESVAHKTDVTFVVANNHFRGKAVVNALQLRHMLSTRRVRVPEPLVKRYPELERIVDEGNGAEKYETHSLERD